MSGVRKRSVSIAGHATSVSLEPAFWDALTRLAAVRGLAVNRLVEQVDAARDPEGNLSSALRVEILRAALTREI
ncbi:ribbon-helix-helix domain-containing protein [Inquilinus limosus]|uniref:ribbon-helix-helix domain-containing protein n=1 Tax=Inquilinus limosus TaxID=171674 RepID=UPI003F183983